MNTLIRKFTSEYEDLLRDESRKVGSAERVAFPETERDLRDILSAVSQESDCVTTQGARTGITASAVPEGGTVINLARMKDIGRVATDSETGEHSLIVQPGALLEEVRAALDDAELFFPPDPTETSASIGGMVACNASGAISFHYGPTRNWIRGLRVVLCDGSVLNLKRGDNVCTGRDFTLCTEEGRKMYGRLPSYTMPAVKNAAGYYVADNMDMIDLFIGMEGTLGIISEIELAVIGKPAAVAGITGFLPSESAALEFVRRLRAVEQRPVAIEFFNNTALNMMRAARQQHPAFGDLPELPPHFHSAVYVEFHEDTEAAIDDRIMMTAEALVDCGGAEDDCWCATTDREMERLKSFRHSTPELVNLTIDERRKSCPELTKLGTDMSVPDSELENVMKIYNEGLEAAGLEYVIFGHIGNNHVHVNIIPKNMQEYDAGKELYLEWAGEIVSRGGSVSAEHGIGKIKVPFLRLMYGDDGIEAMKRLKLTFDPRNVLNRGNLF